MPLTELIAKDKLDAIIKRTREGGRSWSASTDRQRLLRPGGQRHCRRRASAGPQAGAPGAALLEGQYGIKDYFFGVPVTIGGHGVEKIHEIALNDAEKAEMKKSFESVKKTVDSVKL